MRPARTLFLLLPALLTGCLEPPAEPRTTELAHRAFHLDEVAAWPVENPELIRGGVVEAGGGAVVWTADDEVFHFIPGEDEGVARPELRPPVVRLASETGAEGPWAWSPARGGLVPAVGTDREGTRALGCPELGEALAVVPAPEGFVVLELVGGTSLHRLTLVVEGADGCVPGPEVPVDCAGSTPGIVSPQNGVLFAGCADPARPLQRIELTSGGLHLTEPELSVPAAFREASAPVGQWTVMPLLRIDGGLFRVLAHIGSDLRRLEFWSEEGRHLRTSAVEAPVGFFATSPDDQLLLGLRDDPADELVVFAWSWGAILTGP